MATAKDYKLTLQRLFPRGKLWSVSEGSDLDKLLWAFAAELERVDIRVRDMLRESDPEKAIETLTDWEEEYGIPSDCGGVADDLIQRKLDLKTKIAAQGGQSIEYFQSVFAENGIAIEVTTKPTLKVGEPVGLPLTGANRYTWYVNIPTFDLNYLEAGESVGQPILRAFDQTNVMCLLLKYKPAHTHIAFTFDEA